MKKLLGIILAYVLLLCGLTACGGNNDNSGIGNGDNVSMIGNIDNGNDKSIVLIILQLKLKTVNETKAAIL